MGNIQLTPEVLLQQSNELATLQKEYESLFNQVKNSLNGINQSWSTNIASNFSGKITSAQNSFSSIINMFANGANAAKASATRFGTPSSWLEKITSSGVGKEYKDGYNNIANMSREEVESMFPDKYKKASNISGTLGTAAKTISGLKDKAPGVGFGITIGEGAVQTWMENNDPDREINSFIKNNMPLNLEKTSKDAVDALNKGDYLTAGVNYALLGGFQVNYDVFNTATNIAGNAFGKLGKFYAGVNDLQNATGIKIQQKECQFMENGCNIIASKLKDLM